VKDKRAELSTQLALGKPVDTTGIAKWGRDKGIALVQLVVQDTIGTSPIENIAKRVAWLVDCNTGKLSGRGTFRLRFPSPPYLEDKAKKISLVGVRGGTFEMGCKAGRDDKTVVCGTNEVPLHWVKVNDFKIGKYEITQGVWKAVMGGSLPSDFYVYPAYMDDNKPIMWVSYGDVVGADGFLERLKALTGKNYRLPTEAEWEYAARGCEAGNCENFEFSGSDSIDDVAWYGNKTGLQSVGGKLPNGLGIYDMTGNVWEMCNDRYSDTYYPSGTTQDSPQNNPTGPEIGSNRVVHGGGWNAPKDIDYISFRLSAPFDNPGGTNRGFRVVLP
jgi:formylglycine-generating enzyme required for sulfatase activity